MFVDWQIMLLFKLHENSSTSIVQQNAGKHHVLQLQPFRAGRVCAAQFGLGSTVRTADLQSKIVSVPGLQPEVQGIALSVRHLRWRAMQSRQLFGREMLLCGLQWWVLHLRRLPERGMRLRGLQWWALHVRPLPDRGMQLRILHWRELHVRMLPVCELHVSVDGMLNTPKIDKHDKMQKHVCRNTNIHARARLKN